LTIDADALSTEPEHSASAEADSAQSQSGIRHSGLPLHPPGTDRQQAFRLSAKRWSEMASFIEAGYITAPTAAAHFFYVVAIINAIFFGTRDD
jgi:hypothetical protein